MSFLSRLWRSAEPTGTPSDPFKLPAEEETSDTSDEPAKYELVVLNDDAHTFEYVMEVFHDLLGISWDTGYGMAETIHLHGWRVVFTGTWQEVMQKRAEIMARGPDLRLPNSTGPLRVEIHEVE